jgi:hypothetical protein
MVCQFLRKNNFNPLSLCHRHNTCAHVHMLAHVHTSCIIGSGLEFRNSVHRSAFSSEDGSNVDTQCLWEEVELHGVHVTRTQPEEKQCVFSSQQPA